MTTTANFEASANAWLGECQEIINEHYRTRLPNLEVPKLSFEKGSKYWRVVIVGPGQHAAWAFLHTESGDVLRAASFKAPAKHARGNLFDQHRGMGSMSPYGPAYMR